MREIRRAWRFINLRTFRLSLVWKLNSGFIKPQEQDVGLESAEVPARSPVSGALFLCRHIFIPRTQKRKLSRKRKPVTLKWGIKGQREAI